MAGADVVKFPGSMAEEDVCVEAGAEADEVAAALKKSVSWVARSAAPHGTCAAIMLDCAETEEGADAGAGTDDDARTPAASGAGVASGS